MPPPPADLNAYSRDEAVRRSCTPIIPPAHFFALRISAHYHVSEMREAAARRQHSSARFPVYARRKSEQLTHATAAFKVFNLARIATKNQRCYSNITVKGCRSHSNPSRQTPWSRPDASCELRTVGRNPQPETRENTQHQGRSVFRWFVGLTLFGCLVANPEEPAYSRFAHVGLACASSTQQASRRTSAGNARSALSGLRADSRSDEASQNNAPSSDETTGTDVHSTTTRSRSYFQYLKHLISQFFGAARSWIAPATQGAQSESPRKPREQGDGAATHPRLGTPSNGAQNNDSTDLRFSIPTRFHLYFYYFNLPLLPDAHVWDEIGARNRSRGSLRHTFVVELSHLPEVVMKKLDIDEEDTRYGVVLKGGVHHFLISGWIVVEAYIHKLLWSHRHKFPFLVPFLGIARSATSSSILYIIMPKGRNLSDWIKQEPMCNFHLMCAELVCALKDLHDHGIVHRDVKDDNMLVMPDGHVALSDLESLRSDGALGTCSGTKYYRAPEVQRGCESYLLFMRARKLHDVYSLGETFSVLRTLWAQKWNKDVSRAELLDDLIKKMKALNSKDRPTLAQVMLHPYFAGLDFLRVRRKEYPAPFSAVPERVGDKSNAADNSQPPYVKLLVFK